MQRVDKILKRVPRGFAYFFVWMPSDGCSVLGENHVCHPLTSGEFSRGNRTTGSSYAAFLSGSHHCSNLEIPVTKRYHQHCCLNPASVGNNTPDQLYSTPNKSVWKSQPPLQSSAFSCVRLRINLWVDSHFFDNVQSKRNKFSC